MLKHLHRFTSLALSAALLLGSASAFAEDLEVSSTTVGETDNSQDWWISFSDSYEIPVGSILTYSFTNYSRMGDNWDNYNVVVASAAKGAASGYSEYFVLRSDVYGWGNSDYNKDKIENDFDWTNFKSEMNGAQVKVSVYNSSTTICVNCDITTASGKKWQMDYNQANSGATVYSFLTPQFSHLENLAVTRVTESEVTFTAEANVPIYVADGVTPTMPTRGVTAKLGTFRLPFGTATLSSMTSDGKVTATYNGHSATAQFEFVKNCTVVGATDFTTEFNTVKTDQVQVKAGETYTLTYQIRSKGENNWDAASIFLTDKSASFIDYARTDNWACKDWNSLASEITMNANWCWNIFAPSIDGSITTATVKNNGDGTADVRYDVTDGNGITRFQTFSAIPVSSTDYDDLYVHLAPAASYMLIPGAEAPKALNPAAEQSDVQISVVNGNIEVSGADSFSVFDIQGRKVAAQGLAGGIYIVRAGNVAMRVVVRK